MRKCKALLLTSKIWKVSMVSIRTGDVFMLDCRSKGLDLVNELINLPSISRLHAISFGRERKRRAIAYDQTTRRELSETAFGAKRG